MEPKMMLKDAASVLQIAEHQLVGILTKNNLNFNKKSNSSYFTHKTARQIFKLNLPARSIAFQIIKGGTGKTSLAQAFAIRASLYGLNVLCVDLDQQGNLTNTFNVDAETYPIMIDILAEGYSFDAAITEVLPGVDLLASRIENTSLDEVIRLKKLSLDRVYRVQFDFLKKYYDLIVVDCPPNLGQSVAAVTLGVDLVIAPVIPEQFALSGLKVTFNAIKDIEIDYNTTIPFAIALNKFDSRTLLSKDAHKMLTSHSDYKDNLLPNYIRMSQEFPNATARDWSIFDIRKKTIARTDIDLLTREVLAIDDYYAIKAKMQKADKTKNINKSKKKEVIGA